MKKIIFILFAFILFATSSIAADVKLSSPHTVKKGEEFSIYISTSNLQNFYSADFLIKYNSSAMDIVEVCNGSINATEIVVSYSIENGVCRIVAISSDGRVNGDGYLALLKVIPIMEGKFNIIIEGNLSNYNAEKIEVSWYNLTVAFTSSELKIEAGDAVNGEFVAYVNLTNATQFYSINFTLLYDDTFLMPKEIENDSLALSYSIDSGKIKFAGYVDEAKDAEEINIVKILFHPLKTGYTSLNLTHITASNIFAQQIYCLAINKSILISGNVPPVANFTWQPQNPTDLDEITFNASSSYDLDGYIANYTWNFGDGKVGYGKVVQHRYEDDGLYIVNLTVVDNEGAVAWITKQIEVSNVAPVADFDFTPSEPIVGGSIQFNSTSYDLDGYIANYTWNFGDGSIAYGENVSHVYVDEGSYIVNLTVRDDDGAMAWIVKEIVVSSIQLVADFDYTPKPAISKHEIHFLDLSTAASFWHWDFGDNTTSNEKNPVHVYSIGNLYNVTLTIYNGSMNASISKIVRVDTFILLVKNENNVVNYIPWLSNAITASQLASMIGEDIMPEGSVVSKWNTSKGAFDSYIVGISPPEYD
ncbi:MAG TPA: PKD domain-containing protein, partial [Thermoplasmatales archaeon]|nr:PKD domain-containing protein [Thermoplasmatales archaeon]